MLIFNAFIVSSLETLLQNHMIARPNFKIHLKPLYGKHLTLHLHYQGYQAPPCTLTFTFPRQPNDLNLHNAIQIEVGEKKYATIQPNTNDDHVIISITPFDLFRLINKEIELPYENIQVYGNLKILFHFKRLIKLTGNDLNSILFPLRTNPSIHIFTNNLKSALRWGYKNVSQRCNELNDYAKYEAEFLIDSSELNSLKQSVYELNQEINNLCQRVDKINIAYSECES